MSKGTTTPNNNSDKSMEMDLLLKEKYNRERLAEWKKLMPLPQEDSPKKNSHYLKATLGVVLFLVIVAMVLFFSLSRSSPSNLADKYLSNTTIAALDDLNARGDSGESQEIMEIEFLRAVKQLKANGILSESALKKISVYSTKKNKYQAEALWFGALGNIKLDKIEIAKRELEKLKAISSYKKDEVEILLKAISK